MSAPAGWYPTDDGRQRWWDGQAWTEHVSGPVGPPSTAAYPQAYGQQPYGHPAHGHPAYGQPYAGPVVVSPKNPALCLLVSFFLPGVGSFLAERTTNGVIILVGYLLSWALACFWIPLLGVLAFWIWGMVDAYTGAQEWNRRHGILS